MNISLSKCEAKGIIMKYATKEMQQKLDSGQTGCQL